MIELFAEGDNSEGRFAALIRHCFLELWPDLVSDSDDEVRIAANAKIYGYDVQDFDVIVCAQFKTRRMFNPIWPITTAPTGERVRRDISVQSLVVAIEVKGHDQRSLRFEGGKALVRYRRG